MKTEKKVTWTRKAIHAVDCRLSPEAPRGSEERRRRAKLVGWLVERLIDRGEGDRR